MPFFSSGVEQMEFDGRVWNDSRPHADAVLIYSQTEDNQEAVFLKAHELIQEGLVKCVAFATGGKLLGGPSWNPIRKLLQFFSNGELVPVEITAELMHTHTEAEAFIAYAKAHRWKKVYATAADFHQPRAFTNTVSIVLRDYPALRVFSAPGIHLPWMEEVAHSQKTVRDLRYKLFTGEYKRLNDYCDKGDLVSAQKVLDYLNCRGD